jgi:lipoate-protein ligase A
MVYLPKQKRKEEMKMIKNKSELKQKIKEKLEMKASEFIDNLELSEEDFTIEAIEDIMMRFSKETNQIMIEAVNETLSSFDESKIIAKKKKKLQG